MHSARGFTLIELSIVLLIIGLIVGGVLVGQNLVRAAAMRATVSQVEKFNSAVNTFRDKYGYLPGDIPAVPVAQFGFQARGSYAGEGDGNGVIEAVSADAASSNQGVGLDTGEIPVFWNDLTYANGLKLSLIEGNFRTASIKSLPGSNVTGSNLSLYLPQAKLGQGNYFYVWSRGGINFFGLSAITKITSGGGKLSNLALTVAQTYDIDKKMDDGFPQTGNVITRYEDDSAGFHSSAIWVGASSNAAATPSSATTCYDNGNSAGATLQYSLAENGGAGTNCALSFQFQ